MLGHTGRRVKSRVRHSRVRHGNVIVSGNAPCHSTCVPISGN